MPASIDRSRPLLPLTLPWVRWALTISAVLFAGLLVAAFVLLLVAVVWYILCLVWIGLIYVLLYGFASLPILIFFGAIGAAGEGSKGSDGQGCAVGAVILIGLCVLGNIQGGLWDLAGEGTQPVRLGTLNWADSVWDWLTGTARLFFRAFMDYEVYAWSWAVLGTGLATSAGVLALIGIARSVAPARRVLVRVRCQCPRCPAREVLYRCPGCKTPQADLRPSRYGIFTARCGSCSTPLATTDANGRGALRKVCAGCSADLDHPELGRFPEYHIAVVGAKNSGKTTLVVAALMALEEEFAPAKGWRLTFASATEENDYRMRVMRMKSGQPQPQTPRSRRPPAILVGIEFGTGGGALVYLYDAAGEDIQAGGAGGEGVAGHDFHGLVDGVILVVDPFAETGVRAAASARRALPAGLNPAPQDALYVLGRMIPFWVRARRGSSGGRLDFPVAVVVTKLDAGGLDARVGGYVEHLETRPSITEAAGDALARSEEVRRVLREDAASDLLESIESHFATVGYFGVSATGRVASVSDRSAFRSRGAAAPLVWLLARVGAIGDQGPTARMTRTALGWVGGALRGRSGWLAGVLAWVLVGVPFVSAVYPLWEWWGEWPTVVFVGGVVLSALVYRSYRAPS